MWGRKFLAITVVSFLYFISIIPMAFSVRNYFWQEFVILIVLLVLHLFGAGLVHNENKISWQFFSFVYGISMLNVLAVYFESPRIFYFAVAVLATVAGFLYSIVNIDSDESYELEKFTEKIDVGVGDEEVIVEEITPMSEIEEPKKKEKNFVGSLKRAEYHVPSCPGAKRISTQNRVWFTSVKDAETQGYSKHRCVK